MAGEVAVLNHGQPTLTIADQTHPEGQPKGVARADQTGVALRQQQVAQRIPAQLETVLKGLDQALTFPLVERGGQKESFELIKGLAEVGEALLPADIGRHGGSALGAV